MVRKRHTYFVSIALILLGLCAGGCVQRKLTVLSNPPGALVYLNNEEAGRTPFTRDFLWYGDYDVVIRAEGYETLKTHAKVKPPWWQWVPIDLLAELFPLTDRQEISFVLTPVSEEGIDARALLDRATTMRSELEMSRIPPGTTRPVKKKKK